MYIGQELVINGVTYYGYEISELKYDLITSSLQLKVIYKEKSKFGNKIKDHVKWFDFEPQSDVDVNELIDKIIEYNDRFSKNNP